MLGLALPLPGLLIALLAMTHFKESRLPRLRSVGENVLSFGIFTMQMPRVHRPVSLTGKVQLPQQAPLQFAHLKMVYTLVHKATFPSSSVDYELSINNLRTTNRNSQYGAI